MERLRAWLVIAPLVAAGTLAAHVAAYRLTQTPTGSLHSYLEHAPQVVLLVCVLGVALAGLGARLRAPRPWAFAVLAPVAFLVQEHLESLVHTGRVPWILTTPAVLLGLLLQVPLGLVVWFVATRLLRALAAPRHPRGRVGHGHVDIASPGLGALVGTPPLVPSVRAPPSPRRP